MIGAFSTRRPAIAFIPGVRLICHWLLLTSFCPSACSAPRDTRTERQHNTHCELYGGLITLTSRATTPPPPPISERLRWNIARTGNCLPLACALLFRRLSFGSGASTHTPSSIGRTYTAPLMGAITLHVRLLTRREISGGMGKHGKPPPNMRRRPIHGMGGAFF